MGGVSLSLSSSGLGIEIRGSSLRGTGFLLILSAFCSCCFILLLVVEVFAITLSVHNLGQYSFR